MVSDRGLEILRAIVEDYVRSREPVASKTIVDRHNFQVSAATIRNEMAQLEEEELITAPHTSAGRIPTDKGYRVFVNRLDEIKPLTQSQKKAIEKFLSETDDFDETLNRTVRLLSQLTNQVALLQYPVLSLSPIRRLELLAVSDYAILLVLITENGRVEQRVVHTANPVDLLDLVVLQKSINEQIVGLQLSEVKVSLASGLAKYTDDQLALATLISTALIDQIEQSKTTRLVVSGAANLAKVEYEFSGKLYQILEAIEEQVILLKLLAEIDPSETRLSTRIGSENLEYGLSETSLLASQYEIGDGNTAKLGILGPTRMDYSHNLSALQAVAKYLTKALGEK